MQYYKQQTLIILIQAYHFGMGKCMSKLSQIDPQRNNHPITIPPPQYKRKPSQPKNQQQFQNQTPNRRQTIYWDGKLRSVCGSQYTQISEDNFSKFFSYMDLSKDSLRKMYIIFKNQEPTLNRNTFFQGLVRVAKCSQQQIVSFIYEIYFGNGETNYYTFQKQLRGFIKRDENFNNNLRSSNDASKFKQLTSLLGQRKSVTDKVSVQRWLRKNLDLIKFRKYIIQGNIKNDQKQAYKYFWADYNTNQSKISSGNKDIIIVNWRWCQKFLRYMNQKYQVEGAPKLKRKGTIDIENKIVSKISHKDSLSDRRVSSGSEQLRLLTQMSAKEDRLVDISSLKVVQKIPDYNHQFNNYPAQIDNSILIGNFQQQLKRNLRKDVDYLTLKEQTYEKLHQIYGGGPKIKRRVVQGYIQLRPYFIIKYLFRIDPLNNQKVLHQKQSINISSTQTLSKLLENRKKQSIFYHKNIGREWEKFPPQNVDIKNTKIIDVLSQTSFLVYMDAGSQSDFKKLYLQKKKSPSIGQIYSSNSYKILDSIQQRTLNTNPVQICIIDDQNSRLIQFVVMNWSHHVQRKISDAQFKHHFSLKKNYLQFQHTLKRNRAGISNLGNTCYMNAAIQAILSTVKEDYIKKPKGQLGVQLLYIARKITQWKKSVFPVDFKTKFDKYFVDFKGNDQHDAHQFCIRLFQQFQHDNRQLMQSIFNLKLKFTNQCTNCKKRQTQIDPNFIVSLPLRDFAKKQVKIDYITQNRNITTVIFPIQQNCTIQDWRRNFEKISGAKNYYLCQIQNGTIQRTFNREDKQQSDKYSDLNIQNNFLITAFETKPINYDLKVQKYYDFHTYKDPQGNFLIARGQQKINLQLTSKSQDIENSNSETPKIRVRVKSLGATQYQQKTLFQKQLLKFPETFPLIYAHVKVINYDDNYDQIIGKPFIFKIPSHYPIKAIRLALEECIGRDANGYCLRVSPKSQLGKCQICKGIKSYHHNQRQNSVILDCFKSKQTLVPVLWVQGLLQFVVGWKDAAQYNNLIKRTPWSAYNKKNVDKAEQFDNFELALKKFNQKQKIQLFQCEGCKMKNVIAQRNVQISNWPKVLILHLQRFTIKIVNNSYVINKIHTKWEIQQVLYINGKKYILNAVVCHIGTTVDYGHYITVSNGFCYDDQLVTTKSYAQVPPESVYILFYHEQE